MLTYKDPVKNVSREKLRDFISRHLKNYSELRVVCFPGAEIQGEEALEVREVYDPLGIPRQNIVGLEYKRKKARLLADAGLGIRVVNSPALRFFETTNEVYDIISLDYTGHQRFEEIEVIRAIAERQVLAKTGIIVTNHSARREGRISKATLLSSYLTRLFSDSMPVNDLPDSDHLRYDFAAEKARQVCFEGAEIPLPELRKAITGNLLDTMKKGSNYYPTIDKLVRANPNYKTDKSNLKDILKEADASLPLPEFYDSLEKNSILPKEWTDEWKSKPEDNPFVENYFLGMALVCELAKKWHIDVLLADIFFNFLVMKQTKAYIPGEIERYSYDSNKNMTMHMDIAFFDQQRKFFQRWEKLITAYFDRDAADIVFDLEQIGRENPKKLEKNMRAFAEEYFKYNPKLSIPERTYLGSSYRRESINKEKLSKNNVVRLLKEGVSAAEIAELNLGYSEHQLRAFKAHYITMGKEID